MRESLCLKTGCWVLLGGVINAALKIDVCNQIHQRALMIEWTDDVTRPRSPSSLTGPTSTFDSKNAPGAPGGPSASVPAVRSELLTLGISTDLS